jgi:hypothetical protein
MKRSVFVRSTVSSLIAALALTASAVAQQQPVTNVSVEGLYTAVNNAANAGAIVVLASGTYTLTAKDPSKQPRPNDGRLVLQSGIALVGQNRYVDFHGDGVWDRVTTTMMAFPIPNIFRIGKEKNHEKDTQPNSH